MTGTDDVFLWNSRGEHRWAGAGKVPGLLAEGWKRIEPPVEIEGFTVVYQPGGSCAYVPDGEVEAYLADFPGSTTTDPVTYGARVERKIAALARNAKRRGAREEKKALVESLLAEHGGGA